MNKLELIKKDLEESADYNFDNWNKGDLQMLEEIVIATENVVKKLTLTDVSNSAYLCKNVNGEDAIVMAENIADVFDKLEYITPTPEVVEVSGKSTTLYK